MKIFLCYRYHPHATALYFEKALHQLGHEVYSIASSSRARSGYPGTQDLNALISGGMPMPDLAMLVDPSGEFFPHGWEILDCPTAIYLIDVHIRIDLREMLVPFFDYIFIAQLDYVDHFRRLGNPQTFWLPLACDPEIHGPRQFGKKWDIGFVGQVHSPNRARYLQLLADKFKINDYHKYYPKEQIADVYSQSRIVFNNAINGDLNMRVFEGLASGSLLVTECIPNGQSDLFKHEEHLVEYSNDDELLKVVNYYLEHDTERERIAHAGHKLVIAKHTYSQRCHFIIDTIFSDGQPQLKSLARQFNSASLRSAYSRVYRKFLMMDAVLEELELAWRCRQGYAGIFKDVIEVFVRSLYRTFRLPPKHK